MASAAADLSVMGGADLSWEIYLSSVLFSTSCFSLFSTFPPRRDLVVSTMAPTCSRAGHWEALSRYLLYVSVAFVDGPGCSVPRWIVNAPLLTLITSRI